MRWPPLQDFRAQISSLFCCSEVACSGQQLKSFVEPGWCGRVCNGALFKDAHRNNRLIKEDSGKVQ